MPIITESTRSKPFVSNERRPGGARSSLHRSAVRAAMIFR